MKRPLLLCISLTIAGALLVACTGSSDGRVNSLEGTIRALTEPSSTPRIEISPTARATSTARATATPKPQPLGMSRSSPVPLGTPLLVPEGWEVTLLSYEPDAWPEVQAANQFNDPPAAGKRFALVRVSGKNVSAGESERFDASFYLKAVGSAGVGYSTGCGVVPDGFILKDTEAFAGGVIEGNVCFEVGIDETNLVVYTDFFSFDDSKRRWFALQ